MTKTATIRLYTPADFFARVIAWRLESEFCHATIELDGYIYSATVPHILKMTLDNVDVAQPPRGGISRTITLSDDEHAKALAYCVSMLGSDYDILAMAAWAFRIQWMQRPNHVYCFEYVADALAAAGLFPHGKRLISGDQLLNGLYVSGRIINPTPMPEVNQAAAAAQKPSISVPAPQITP